ncbi:MAG: N-acetylglucosamine-6-phosphate deacetylase [Anaerolineales bacterium]|nr:N-acetylglucosamine-6-phosphate deacetylase [Anaerolineales bacterium]
MLYLENATLLTDARAIPNGAILIEDRKILAAGPAVGLPAPSSAHRVDTKGAYIAPGFFDLQLNGGFGLDFTADPTTIWAVAAQLPQYGVTAFLPTIITNPLERFAEAIEVLRAGPPSGFRGAIPLGFHFEGPFLNPEKKGAHNPELIRPPAPELVTSWTSENHVFLVTLAPERPGALETIRALRAQGVVVSAGHSMATVAEGVAGIEAGITMGTHLFNAMRPFDHREPGLIGALSGTPGILPAPFVGLIPDGVHVHPTGVAMAWKIFGWQRTVMVTDAMAAMGMPDGDYVLGGQTVKVKGPVPRLANGTLAGSVLTMDAGVRNLIAFTGCSPAEAVYAASRTPARAMGFPDRGRLAHGAVADLVFLDQNLQVTKVFQAGEIIFET